MIHLGDFHSNKQSSCSPSCEGFVARLVQLNENIFLCFPPRRWGVENVFIYDNENILCMFWQI